MAVSLAELHQHVSIIAQDPDARLKLEEMLKGDGMGGAKFGNVDDWLKNIKVEQPAGGVFGAKGGKKTAPAPDDVEQLLGDDLVKDHDEL